MITSIQNFVPRNGRELRVVRVARISTLRQDERSLDDQLALLDRYVRSVYEGPVNYIDLATQGSGEALDREELAQLEQLISTGQIDVVIAEDLSRICRRLKAIEICGLCEDSQTRLIAINDRVDTADPSWRDGAIISSWHHERSNFDTSHRIRRSLRNRFANGRLLSNPGPFYVVPEGATSIDEVQKRPGVESIVLHGIEMLEDGRSFSEVADWLNSSEFPVGGSCRRADWNGVLVRARFLDPRLKGVEEWNRKISVRINKTGRRRSQIAPDSERILRPCPHLAFIDESRFDRLVQMISDRNSIYRRPKDANGNDPLRNRPRRRTPFPGQMLYCGICGHKMVFGGHGRTDHLMCDGSRAYKCWNGATVDAPLAAQRIATAVLEQISELPDFDRELLAAINAEAREADSGRQQRLTQLLSDQRRLERAISNLATFISAGDISEGVRQRLRQSEEDLARLRNERLTLESMPTGRIEIPDLEELKRIAREAIQGHFPYSWDFNLVMRRLTPRIVAFPVRLIDGGHIEMRASFRLQIGGLVGDQRLNDALRSPLERLVTVDVFEPPQREQFRQEIVRHRANGMTERQISSVLGLTVTAIQRAAALQRQMNRRGLSDPYERIDSLPVDYTKIRRHLHERYNFEPLPNAGEV